MLAQKNTQTLSNTQLVGLVGGLTAVGAVGAFIAISALSKSQTVMVRAQAVTPIIANAATNLLQTNTLGSATISSNSSTEAGNLMTQGGFAPNGIALKR